MQASRANERIADNRWHLAGREKVKGLTSLPEDTEWVLMGRNAVPVTEAVKDGRSKRVGQFLFGSHFPNGRRFVLKK